MSNFYVLYKNDKIMELFSENDPTTNNIPLMLRDQRIDGVKVVNFEELQRLMSSSSDYFNVAKNLFDQALTEAKKHLGGIDHKDSLNNAFKEFQQFFEGKK